MFWRKKEPQNPIKSCEQWEREADEVFAVRVLRCIGENGVRYAIEIYAPSIYDGEASYWRVHCFGIDSYEKAVKAADLLFKTKGEPETVYEIGPQDRGTRP